MLKRRFGPALDKNGVTFRLWAPRAKRVDVVLDEPHPLKRDPGGWYSGTTVQAGPGTRYKFRIDGEIDIPDPASQFQPEDAIGRAHV